jgi:hypothetical protein
MFGLHVETRISPANGFCLTCGNVMPQTISSCRLLFQTDEDQRPEQRQSGYVEGKMRGKSSMSMTRSAS